MTEFELVLPCYNESKSLETILKRAVEAAMQAGYDSSRFQLLLVENGSKDDSAAVMKALKAGPLGSWFRHIQVEVNQGYGNGLWSGLKQTQAKYVAWSHADQQCDPKDAFLALDKLKKKSDGRWVIKGTRSGRNARDRLVSWVFATFARIILGLPTDEINAQPKVFGRELLNHVVAPPKDFAFDMYVLFRAKKQGYKIDTIPVLFPPRIHGFSNWASSFFGRYRTILGMIGYMFRLCRKEGRA